MKLDYNKLIKSGIMIETEEQYEETLQRIEQIFDALPNTAEGDELEYLAKMVEDYETEHYSF